MRMYPREFPPNRRGDPKRRAERRVYEALAGSDRHGFVYYEWRRGYERIELDFAVWIEGSGRFALQVKGGQYLIMDGEWYLKTRTGSRSVRCCPLDETKLGTLDLHDDIVERACALYNPFVIPVLLFPDMTEPDAAIENLAKRKGVYVIWGIENLMTDLEDVIQSRRVSDQLPAERIAHEVSVVTDGLIRLGRSAGAAESADGEVATVSEQRMPAAVRLAVGGRTVLTIRSSVVRCCLNIRTHPEREPGRQ